MATREEKVILDIELKEDDIATRLGAIAEETNRLKTQNSELRKQMKSGEVDWKTGAKAIQENELQLKSLKAAEKDASGQLAILTAYNRTYSDSNAGVRAQVLELERQINSLSKAEKNSAGGKALINKQNELKASVKESAEELGNFQDSVGNYPQVFDLSGTAIGKMKTMLEGLGGTSTSVGGMASNAFAGMKAQAISLGKAFLTLPIGAIVIVLGAIMLAVQKLSAAFKKNDEAGTKLEQAFAQFKPIAEAISWIFDKLAVVIANLILGFSRMATAVLNLIPAYKKSAKAAEELVLAQDRLEDKENEYTVNSAKRNREIARLKKELTQTEKYSAEEREKIAKQIDNLELENLNENRKILAAKYNNLVKYYKQEKDTSDAAKKAKADAYAAFINADTQYFEATTRVGSRLNSARKEQRAEDEANAKEANEKAEQRRKEADEREKQRLADEAEAKRKTAEDSIKTLDYELNLWKLKRKEANAKIKEDDDTAVINRLTELDKEFTVSTEKLRISLENKLITQEEYNSQLVLLEQEKNTEIAIIEAEADAKRREEQKARDEKAAAERLAAVEKYEDDIQKAKESIASQNEILELERQQSLLDAEYQAAVENALKTGASTALIDEEYALKRQEIFNKTTQANLSNASDFAGNLATIFGESTKLGKAAAAAQVAIDTYKGALAAYSAAASIPIVGQALGIAAAAAVTVKGTKAIKDIYAVKDSFSAKRFARGLEMGAVPGNPATGDSVRALLTPGERVMNKQQQENLFRLIASGNFAGTGGIDYELLAKAMAKQPAPVIGMKEFLSFQEKIATFDEQIKI